MQVTLKNSANKTLQKLPLPTKTNFKTLIDQISDLNIASEIENASKLKGYTDRYKIRIGNYRMIYKVESESHILITAIAHRKDIYNKLFGVSF